MKAIHHYKAGDILLLDVMEQKQRWMDRPRSQDRPVIDLFPAIVTEAWDDRGFIGVDPGPFNVIGGRTVLGGMEGVPSDRLIRIYLDRFSFAFYYRISEGW